MAGREGEKDNKKNINSRQYCSILIEIIIENIKEY